MQPSDADQPISRTFVTGEWTVTPSRNLLARGAEDVRVEPRVMDVLVALAERPGEVVSKDELVRRVWEGRFVTDDVLTVTVYALRKALGDEARHPRYLETVSRRGYRWIAPVVPAAAGPADEAPVVSPAARPETAPTAPPRSSWRTAAQAAALILFAVGAAWVLTPARRGRHVPAPASQEAYAKGRSLLDKRSIKGWQEALQQFERAVALDPQSSAAHAGLADTYSAMSDFGVASPAEMRPRAMESARRALELDGQSAEGHEALGRAAFLFDWDFAAARKSLGRALELDVDFMPAYQALAWLESAEGHPEQAIAAARRALQLDPVNTARYTELAWVLSLSGRYADAQREIDRALQLSPESFGIYFSKGWAFEASGQPAAAFAAYREGMRLGGAPEDSLRRAEALFQSDGLPGFYRAWIERQPRGGTTPMSDTFRAMVYARAGQPDRALESLDKAYAKREGALAWVNVEPSFRPLRADERFQRIAKRVGGRP